MYCLSAVITKCLDFLQIGFSEYTPSLHSGTHKHSEMFILLKKQHSTLTEVSIWTQHLFSSLELFIWK